MTTCPSMNLRQVSVLEKMKIENALFCIISNSDLGRSGPIGSHFRIFFISQIIKRAGPFAYFFSKIVHIKGLFEKIKKKFDFLVLSRNSRYLRTGVLKSFSYKRNYCYCKNGLSILSPIPKRLTYFIARYLPDLVSIVTETPKCFKAYLKRQNDYNTEHLTFTALFIFTYRF